MRFFFLGLLLAFGCGENAGASDADGEEDGDAAAEDPGGVEESRDDGDITAEVGDHGQDADLDPAEDEAPLLPAALYDDTASDSPSAWPEGLDMLERALGESGYACERITRPMLNDPSLDLSRFSAVVFGGGFAYPGYTLMITEEAKARLRTFVESGGVFMGVCAGAFFACDRVQWEGTTYDDESGYTLDLMAGLCTGPIESLSVYPEWALAEIGFQAHPALEGFDEAPFSRTLWYGAGPFFIPLEAAAETVAVYDSPGLPERGEAALVTAAVGSGRIILWGPHPEVRWEGASPDAWRLAGILLRWAAGQP
jgi:glutamine amidotransferase-like uncharacterized protein